MYGWGVASFADEDFWTFLPLVEHPVIATAVAMERAANRIETWEQH